ncbi:MAG: thiol-disulfide isomerase [Acidobacteria bacterium]|nr:thiol-disulfide isomerase [Acidobacteriota bacterium]
MRIRKSVPFALAVCCTLAAAFAFLPAGSANSTPAKKVTFTKDVAPIFYKSCAECHRAGEGAPFSVMSYKDVRPWAKSIKEKVANRVMPPWHADQHAGVFANDRRLSQAEIETVTAWVDGGAIEGNTKDLPPAPTFTTGWNIGKPDLIVKIPDVYTYKPGVDEYQYFDVDPQLKEDVYVSKIEARPTNPKVVHHILAFIIPPGAPNMAKMSAEARDKAMEAQLKNSPLYRDGFLMRMKPDQPVIDDGCTGGRSSGPTDLLAGYAPGHNADHFPAGVVRKIPAGATIRFQIHYSNQTLGGNTVEQDQSMIGFVYAQAPGEKLMTSGSIGNMQFKIPAGADNHRVTACRTFKRDTTIYAFLPHMHLRGKSMEYKAIYPDGKAEVLMSSSKYDFAWQTNYVLKEPKRLSAGTRLMVTAYYDNSTKNKFNPDPTKDVRHGEPTYDEMMLGFMDYVTEMPAIAKIDEKLLDAYTGKYLLETMAGKFNLNVTRSGNKLIVNIPFRSTMEFVPQSETKFFMQGSDTELTIVKNDKGEIIGADMNGQKVTRLKEDPAGSGQ